jgi:hypothetical protein
MTGFPSKELRILDDAVLHIRENRTQYLRGADRPSGEYLSEAIASTLIWLGATPFTVRVERGWWIITSEIDWLRASDGIDLSVFSRIVPLPKAGPNSMRGEVLLSAFADAVLTVDGNGLHWIVAEGREGGGAPTAALFQSSGRLISFRI